MTNKEEKIEEKDQLTTDNLWWMETTQKNILELEKENREDQEELSEENLQWDSETSSQQLEWQEDEEVQPLKSENIDDLDW